MSADPRTMEPHRPPFAIREGSQMGNMNPAPVGSKPESPPAQYKSASGDKVRHGSKDQEIENLKRLLANVSQRLDALKNR